MSCLFSIVTPRVCQSIEETKLKRPPDPRQRFDDIDLLARREITLEWFCAKTERPCLQHHPPQRRSTTIHLGVLHIPASSKCKDMTNPNYQVDRPMYLHIRVCARKPDFQGVWMHLVHALRAVNPIAWGYTFGSFPLIPRGWIIALFRGPMVNT